ncbi:geranylgeranylglyceryl/heptaprenylglyceryl phosphate synthase [Flavobacteriales bacterium]|mgnify:FL=1|nr:geranylgeranylglyceryl/heptaprenylglyceryl phosphate synthase [bacterium]MDC1485983.1 geranylgeranylglyceryl/heptaprenylglyceryl phosphate synthase [Flavobacteriales bacterium]
MTWLEQLQSDSLNGTKRLAALLDPDDLPSGRAWYALIDRIEASPVTDIFIGGSLLIRNNVSDMMQSIRERFSGKITIFPGSPDQVISGADAVLFLSVISGRNPDLLIGRHVESAMRIRRLRIETIPTGYLLIGDGPLTTAAYMSQSMPIPSAKPEIAVATAVAGEMLGLRVMFVDAGSGASQPVPLKAIASIRNQTTCPLIVGGGLNDAPSIEAAWQAGADLVVIGSAIENKPEDLNWLPNPAAFQSRGLSDTWS